MIRFIDIRCQGTGYRFSFWDTITDRFVCIADEYAWDKWSEFEAIAESRIIDTARFKILCPEWVFNNDEDNLDDF